MVERWIFRERSAIDDKEYLIVTLDVEPAEKLSIEEAAVKIAKVVSLSNLKQLPYEVTDSRREDSAKVLRAHSSGHVTIAYPLELMGQKAGIPPILTILSYPAEYDFTESYFVREISLPERVRSNMPGPKYGKEGLQRQFNKDRPAFGVITKPRIGSELSTIAKHCRLALEGGADFIVDDELVVNPDSSLNFEKRVATMSKIAEEAERDVGEKKSYIPTVSADYQQAVEFATRAEEVGAAAIAVNGFSMGFSNLKQLRESPEFDLPIVTTNVGVGILTRFGEPSKSSGTTGISEGVVAKLSRFSGADAVHAGISASRWYKEEAWGPPMVSLRSHYPNILESLPVVAAGLNIVNLWDNISNLGNDVILEAGYGILGYPSGPKEGAQAFRLLIERLSPEMSDAEAKVEIGEISRNHPHIEEAIEYYHNNDETSSTLYKEN